MLSYFVQREGFKSVALMMLKCLALCCCACSPSFVKIGQALSARPDLLPKQYLDILSDLQDKLPTFPTEIARTGEHQLYLCVVFAISIVQSVTHTHTHLTSVSVCVPSEKGLSFLACCC